MCLRDSEKCTRLQQHPLLLLMFVRCNPFIYMVWLDASPHWSQSSTRLLKDIVMWTIEKKMWLEAFFGSIPTRLHWYKSNNHMMIISIYVESIIPINICQAHLMRREKKKGWRWQRSTVGTWCCDPDSGCLSFLVAVQLHPITNGVLIHWILLTSCTRPFCTLTLLPTNPLSKLPNIIALQSVQSRECFFFFFFNPSGISVKCGCGAAMLIVLD